MADLVNVHVGHEAKTFFVPCPRCGQATEMPAPAGASVENPFPFACRCGSELRVQMNFRRRPRKRVDLAGAVTFSPSKSADVCTVEDLSVTGLGLSLYPPSAATPGAQAVVKVVLNDPQSSRLTLGGVVRRVGKIGARLVVGIEFGRLPAFESQALNFYFM